MTNLILILGIAVILLSASISQSAFADGTIDQNNLGEPRAGAFPLPSPIVDGSPRISQSFTPTVQRLDAVEIEIISPSSLNGPTLSGPQLITVNILDPFGEPTSRLGTAILPPSGQCSTSCVIHIDLDAPITLVPGEPHILEIIPGNIGMGWFQANVPDPYPRGDLIILGKPQSSDLIFATLQDLSVTEIIVVVTDAIGVSGTATIFVQSEVDTAPPVITLKGDPTVTLLVGETYTDAGATALDDVDGDLTGTIVTVNPVDTSTAGTYIVTYNVSDFAGNAAAQVTRTVIVQTSAEAIQSLIDILQGIIDRNPDTPLADAIQDTIDEAQDVLDELSETPPDNDHAVKDIADAVDELQETVDDELLDSIQGIQLMEQFSGIARQIAVNAIDDAIAQGGDAEDINEAQDLLAEGDALRASNGFEDAVDSYEDAVKKAEGALEYQERITFLSFLFQFR